MNHSVSNELLKYQVIMRGYLNPDWRDWLDGIEISHNFTDQGLRVTAIVVEIPDQSALLGILNRLHMFSLELLVVKRLGIGNID